MGVSTSGKTSGAGATCGTELLAVPSSVSISAITSPTCTTSFSLNNTFISLPATGEGTSESTLSVAISKIISSALMLSPTFFTHLIRVASATLSPILGSVN